MTSVKTAVASVALLAILGATGAEAALVVTDGNFETNGGFGANVTEWFDGTTGPNPWSDTFQDTVPQAPQSGTTVVFSGEGNPQNFLYQAIGTREATDASLGISMVVANAAVTGTLTVSIYQQDGAFTAADGTDVTSETLIATQALIVNGPTSNVQTPSATLSLATANLVDTIYLRFHYTTDWLKLDNIVMTVNQAVIPAPAALPAGLGLLSVIGLRRRRRRDIAGG